MLPWALPKWHLDWDYLMEDLLLEYVDIDPGSLRGVSLPPGIAKVDSLSAHDTLPL